jgi:hypothetical protein
MRLFAEKARHWQQKGFVLEIFSAEMESTSA